MSAKQAINDKLQGRVAAYLRCGGVIICNQIKKGLLLSLRVKKLIREVPKFQQIQDGGRPPLKPVKSPFICDRSTDLD